MARTSPVAVAAALLALAPLLGCPGPRPADCSPEATKAGVLATARDWYLFADRVPDFAAFDPADPTLSPQQFLDAIVAAAGAPDAGRGFSYLTTKAASSQFFGAGQSQGYGFVYRVTGEVALGEGRLEILDVLGDDPAAAPADQSPAFKAGLARGDEVVAVALAQADLGLDASQLPAILEASATTDPGAFTAALGGGSDLRPRWFRLRKAGAAAPVEVTATIALYLITPVPGSVAPIVLDVPAAVTDTGADKKVGYLALRTFIGPATPALRQAFASFKARGVTDLIIDLRYDGGGQLDVAATFIDLLSAGQPGSKFGLRHNPSHGRDDFEWPGADEPSALAPARVAFIMMKEYSASASELLPFALVAAKGADVAVVGEASYGKPAGQYGFSSPDCPELLYLLSFQLSNRLGVRAEYFGGLPDAAWAGASCAAADDLTHLRGDPAEGMTGAALRWIADRSCAGGAIPVTGVAARRARVLAAPEAPEPSLAQRHVPGLY